MIEWLPMALAFFAGSLFGFVICALLINNTITTLENEVYHLRSLMRIMDR